MNHNDNRRKRSTTIYSETSETSETSYLSDSSDYSDSSTTTRVVGLLFCSFLAESRLVTEDEANTFADQQKSLELLNDEEFKQLQQKVSKYMVRSKPQAELLSAAIEADKKRAADERMREKADANNGVIVIKHVVNPDTGKVTLQMERRWN